MFSETNLLPAPPSELFSSSWKQEKILSPASNLEMSLATISPEAKDYFNETFSDPEVTKYLQLPQNFTLERFVGYHNGSATIEVPSTRALYFINQSGQDADTRKVLGHISIKNIDPIALSFEIGTVVRKPWGQGVGTNSVQMTIEHMRKLQFKTAIFKVKEGNTRSIGIARKIFGKPKSAPNQEIHFQLSL